MKILKATKGYKDTCSYFGETSILELIFHQQKSERFWDEKNCSKPSKNI